MACLATAGLVLLAGASPLAAQAPDVAALHWRLHCSGCHQPDGSGTPGAVPDLRGNLGYLVSGAQGRRYVLQVPGVAQARLSDLELAGLTNWMVRAFAAGTLPADFSPFSAEEVAAGRRSVPADVSAVRRRVVATLREQGLPAR